MPVRLSMAAPAALILLVLALGGCYMGTAAGTSPGGGDAGSAAGDDGGGVTAQTGLPCAVAQAMQPCLSCHLAGGSGPMPLVTYADLTAADRANPGVTVAVASLARMQDNARPMPPAPLPRSSSADQTALASWIQASYPHGSCGGSDGGTPANDPLGAAPTCTSGRTTAGGDGLGSLMHPGGACNFCHGTGEGPTFTVAGTVYPTGHEPNDCNAALPAGVTVVITSHTGQAVTLTPNADGNFTYSGTLALPYTAVVKVGSTTRAMVAAQQSGDCNSCHTQAGANGAPGRITVPVT